MAAITSQAKAIAGLGHGPNHFFQAEVGKAVEADELTDFLHGTGRGYQFSPRGKVNPIMAGKAMGRTAHPHVDFLCSGFPIDKNSLWEGLNIQKRELWVKGLLPQVPLPSQIFY